MDYFDAEIIRLTDIPKKIESTLLINNETVEYFVSIIDAKDLQTYSINDYAWNRKLNQEHVDKIYNNLIKMENPHLIGTFKIIHNKRFEECYIFDGQHRRNAILKKLSQNKYDDVVPWSMDITIEVYSINCAKIENSKTAEHLFCMANNILVFDISQLIDTYIQDISKQFQDDVILGTGINKGIKNTCNSIFIKDLFNSLQRYFIPKTRPPIEQVILLIKKKNFDISNLDISKNEVFPGYKFANPQMQLKMRNKFIRAKRANFCLNLEGYPPSKWIEEIVNSIDIEE